MKALANSIEQMTKNRLSDAQPSFQGRVMQAKSALPWLMIGALGLTLFLAAPAWGQDRWYASRSADEKMNEGVEPTRQGPTGRQFIRLTAVDQLPPQLRRTLSLHLRGATLAEALGRISEQSGVNLIYGNYETLREKRVTLHLEQATVGEALNTVIQGTDLEWMLSRSGRLMLVNPRDAKVPVHAAAPALQPALNRLIPAKVAPLRPRVQTGTIAGTVTDSTTGEPLPGVNVVIAGTQRGASTDAEGRFVISDLEPGAYDLLASFVGYATKRIEGVEVITDDTTRVDITMSRTRLGLDEVVVVGYGTQERADLTGAISTVSAEEIEQAAVSSVTEALAGKVAGVRITKGGWDPSAGTSIRVRGTRSISAGNSPLIVVNGVPWSGSLQAISTAIVSSVEVLKGTSATAIYGSRGANGVILITTKQGSPNVTQVTYNAYVGVQRPYRHLDLMNSQEWVAMVREAYRTAGRGDAALSDMLGSRELAGFKSGIDTDWQELVFRTGLQQDHTIQLSGGNEQTRFMISPSYFYQQGILKAQWHRRYSLYGNLNHQFSDRFQAGVSVIATRNEFSNGPGGVLNPAVNLPPVVGPYDKNGNLMLLPNNENTTANPLANLQNAYREVKSDRVRAVLSAQYEFSPALSYKLQFSPEVRYRVSGGYYGSETGRNVGSDPTAFQSEDRFFHYTWNNILQFQKTFADRHDVELTFVHTLEQRENTVFRADVRGLPYNSLFYNLGTAREITGVGSNLSEWTLLSFAGRFNYILNDKYLLTLTAREDASSRLAKGNKWSFFPSIAVAWRISNEPFMEPLTDLFSNLKLRVGYGQSGNTSIAPYQVLGGLGRTSYVFGSEPAFGYIPEDLPNPALAWETTTQLNVGLDVGLWQGRLSARANFYVQNTSNLLLTKQLPTSIGYSSVLTNVGKTRNVGLELSLSSINISNGDFQWTTDLNFTTNKNEIVALYGTGGDDVANEWFIGAPIEVYYDQEFGGIWQQDEAAEAAKYGTGPGRIRPADQNGDGKIDAADRVILGTPFPNWTAGLTNTMSYKNIDFSFVVTTVQGNMIFNAFRTFFYPLKDRYNAMNVDYWTPSNPSNEWPRPDLTLGSAGSPYRATLGYVDGSYVRIKRITLGYTLPSGLVQSLGGESWRLYVTAQNPYIFTSDDFMGFDPESSSAPSDAPSYRTFLFGMNLRF